VENNPFRGKTVSWQNIIIFTHPLSAVEVSGLKLLKSMIPNLSCSMGIRKVAMTDRCIFAHNFGQPDLVEDVPAHGRGVDEMVFKGPF